MRFPTWYAVLISEYVIPPAIYTSTRCDVGLLLSVKILDVVRAPAVVAPAPTPVVERFGTDSERPFWCHVGLALRKLVVPVLSD